MKSQCPGSDHPWVILSIMGNREPALIDTGASRTLMSEELYKRLPRQPKLEPGPRLVSVNDSELDVLGETIVKLDRHTGLRVVVVRDVSTPLLVGADALQQAGSVVDFAGKTVTISGKKFPFTTKKVTGQIEQVSELPPVAQPVLRKILEEYKAIFGGEGTLGECTLPAVGISTGNAAPIRQKAYRLPFQKREIVEVEVNKMLKSGVISRSMSPWASPVTLVPKKMVVPASVWTTES